MKLTFPESLLDWLEGARVELEGSDVFTSEYSADLSSSRSLATADIEDSLMDMSIPQLRRYPTMVSLMETLSFSSAVVASQGRRMSHLMA